MAQIFFAYLKPKSLEDKYTEGIYILSILNENDQIKNMKNNILKIYRNPYDDKEILGFNVLETSLFDPAKY